MHDDDALLEAVERLSEQHGTFRTSVTRLVLRVGDRLVIVEQVLIESIADRARLRAELRQLRQWVYGVIIAVSCIVIIFLLAVLFGGR